MQSIWQSMGDQKMSTGSQQLVNLINEAEAIVVGIGAGMSAADSFTYTGPRFTDNFGDFITAYGFYDMLQAASYDYSSQEEYWAFQSRFGLLNYIDQPVGPSYINLHQLLGSKNYHIITTNADNALRVSGYNPEQVYYYQGKFGYMQCSKFCHTKIYYGDPIFRDLVDKQENMRIPTEAIPRCPKCGMPMSIFKRTEEGMVENEDFDQMKANYEQFLKENIDKKTLYLEIGVGFTAPYIIKHPFQEMVKNNSKALYVSINRKRYQLNETIDNQTVQFHTDLVALIESAKDIELANN